mmetsp:Transcript_14235/g.21272  ORF Transcript_14235/g.21272 Transcript_14235/m.21272 type:complete len:269 (+) Transcript_14235:66-872(+)|eukprot:CAMPEP_0194084838 /NCGR_PEP_ID=MMETSP0149-20130528/14945_1 /TAXON_ID=122233 /ORGANISM="Chaetoceros debilis, Strain MM31A-1" /LENGTH=268 /DNA_ID=CAMNT_0038767593 /DNA_START=13 /DNA_END=819 /DNA_ORIENTATION=+
MIIFRNRFRWEQALLVLTCLLFRCHSFSLIPLSKSTATKTSSRRGITGFENAHSFHSHDTEVSRQATSLSLSSSPGESDPDYLYYRPQARAPAQGGIWAYTEPNVRRSATTFKSIRAIGGSESTNDIYARSKSSPQSSFQYWYIGKIARTDGTVSAEQAVSCMWNMMEEHACRLRPVELGRDFGKLEIWIAPGDSELEMSKALGSGSGGGFGLDGLKQEEKMNLQKMHSYAQDMENVKEIEVGFIAEVVTNTGKGFYIVRDDEGKFMQ